MMINISVLEVRIWWMDYETMSPSTQACKQPFSRLPKGSDRKTGTDATRPQTQTTIFLALLQIFMACLCLCGYFACICHNLPFLLDSYEYSPGPLVFLWGCFTGIIYFQTETYQSTVLLWFMPFAANTDCAGKIPHFRTNLSLNLFFEVEVATEHKAMGPLKSNVVPCGAAHSCREGPTVWTIGPRSTAGVGQTTGGPLNPPAMLLRFKTCSVVSSSPQQ